MRQPNIAAVDCVRQVVNVDLRHAGPDLLDKALGVGLGRVERDADKLQSDDGADRSTSVPTRRNTHARARTPLGWKWALRAPFEQPE